MEQNYECKFCKAKFHREKTLISHLCVKKQRYNDIGNPGVRIGFQAFSRFYELTTNSKKPKNAMEFIDSPYYTDFVKFGHYIVQLKPIFPEQYIEFVIRNNIKLKDWATDVVFYAYILDLIYKEPPDSAVERSIKEIMEWADRENCQFVDFFKEVSTNEAAMMLQHGKISPWVLYLSISGGQLLDRFTIMHTKYIGIVIDPSFWMKKFKNMEDDVSYIKNILEQAGI